MKGWSIIFEKGLVFITRRKSQRGGKLLFGIVVLLENFLDAQTTHLLPSMLYFKLVSSFFCFFVFFFSYVRDATAAMFVAFCLFVFPSQKPVIFTPDGSGEMG